MSKPLHIFKAGTRTTNAGVELVFTEADLAATAKAYDPQLHEAPLVLGHPKLDAPAQGWVETLTATGIDLHAAPRAVDPQFAESVAAERYKKISAAFYPPQHPANPVPGVYYLRHVGFLGAHPPSVKGLAPVEFADDGADLVVIEFGEDGAAQAPGQVTPAQTPTPSAQAQGAPAAAPETPTMTPEEIKAAQDKLAADKAAQDAQFAEREAQLKAREAATAEAEARAARTDAAAFCEALVSEGRLPAALKARTVELLQAARGMAADIEFAEGDATVKAAPLAALKDLLKALPKSIEFGEVSGRDKPAAPDTTDAQGLATAAVEFVESERQKGRVISVAQAMDHITQQAAR